MVKDKPAPLLERRVSDVFREVGDWQELVSAFADVKVAPDHFIQVSLAGGSRPVPEILRAIANSRWPSGLKEIRATDSLAVFDYRRRFGRARQHRIQGQFLVGKPSNQPVYALVFVDSALFYRHGIVPLMGRLYPAAARPFLTQRELASLLKSLQAIARPASLRVREFSAKRRLQSPARKRFESLRDWTDVSLDTAFQDAHDRDVWFSAVSFDIVREVRGRTVPAGLKGRISKYGHLMFNRDFALLERSVLKEMIWFAADRLKFFSNRERWNNPTRGLAPVRVEYDASPFQSTDQACRLIEALRRFPHGNCTVLHGNPYVHVAMVDNLDYSTADVWVLSQGDVLVVPQLRASEASLRRIVNHIFEFFGEGKVSEYEAT
jgi:hypothetical protein